MEEEEKKFKNVFKHPAQRKVFTKGSERKRERERSKTLSFNVRFEGYHHRSFVASSANATTKEGVVVPTKKNLIVMPSSQEEQLEDIEKDLEKMRLAHAKAEESVDKQEIVKALSQLHGDGGLIGALQAKLDGLVGLSSGYVEELHPKIRARLFSLQVLQTERDELFEKYSEERRLLEEKYDELYQPLYDSRKRIVTGEKE